jgi:hypothetical protein
MNFLFFVFVVLAFTYNLEEPYLITREIIQKVNGDPKNLWKAGVNPVFAGKKIL